MIETETITNNKTKRIIGELKGSKNGPTLIFTAGIHGNEPSGVEALEKLFNELTPVEDKFSGNVYGIRGNIAALEKKVRYIDEDLNRIWSQEEIEHIDSYGTSSEREEQKEIYGIIEKILATETGPFYFFDLHTTSCSSIPFLTVNDSLINREFVINIPLPIVLGIEEYLEGPILSFINELGYVAFGFEGGQHDDKQSVTNHYHFIKICLGLTGVVDKNTIDFKSHYEELSSQSNIKSRFFEIYNYQKIMADDNFKMNDGFKNFVAVKKGMPLAQLNNQTIVAEENSILFMPLYQHQGDDGFFFVRRIHPFFMWLSKHARNWKWLLKILPGVKKINRKSFLVNKNIARILPKQIFHLFGFRSKKLSGKYYIMNSRD